MHEFSTPMMRQYQQIKEQYQDCLLFFRMGDFYELFMEDAHIGSQILHITLTAKSGGKDGKIPMAGVPYHAVDNYLSKLVKAGYKVAICEQVSLPNKHGLVDREVIRIVTPGTVLDEKALEKKTNNYIISLVVEKNKMAISIADISTGYFAVTEGDFDNSGQLLRDELFRLSPAECILPEKLYNDPALLKLIKTQRDLNIYCFHEWQSYADRADTFLQEHFGVSTLESFGIADQQLSVEASAALLGYLQNTQKSTVSHIKKLIIPGTTDTMIMDKSTILNLELFSTIREHDTKGSLLAVIDKTTTAMGGRLLKQWLRKPLRDKARLTARHDAVAILLTKQQERENLRDILAQITDIERIVSRLSVNIGNARDMIHLKLSLQIICQVKKYLTDILTNNNKKEQNISSSENNSLLDQIAHDIRPDIETIIDIIQQYFKDEPPIELREGGLIKDGIHEELDTLRHIVGDSKSWIEALEKKEREKTGISSLKIRFNKVFGFYIEISKANAKLAPASYIRKQTLVNGERFITEDLKKHEDIILTAQEKIYELEYTIFKQILQQILSFIESLQAAAEAIATLDCLLNFAHIAEKYQYIRPTLLQSGEIKIKQGRHPVVERLLEEQHFVPNDVTLDKIHQQLLLITGPNMAGKSVFIRQIAQIVLLNQIGSFVPAEQAELSIVDRIFVRSGASDVITAGLSTFMVEMVETAHILHHATKNSLIVMDEIGRGTSTYDGISIAWAVAEYLVTHFKIPPKTLFATHYHELQELENEYPKQIKNFHMAVTEHNGLPIFLHTIIPGGASHSFGVAVAKLAGIPEEVIEKAQLLLLNLEKRNIEHDAIHSPLTTYPEDSFTQHNTHYAQLHDKVTTEIEAIDISHTTPLEALNKLSELKKLMTENQP